LSAFTLGQRAPAGGVSGDAGPQPRPGHRAVQGHQRLQPRGRRRRRPAEDAGGPGGGQGRGERRAEDAAGEWRRAERGPRGGGGGAGQRRHYLWLETETRGGGGGGVREGEEKWRRRSEGRKEGVG
jgi:hypothetical protein